MQVVIKDKASAAPSPTDPNALKAAAGALRLPGPGQGNLLGSGSFSALGPTPAGLPSPGQPGSSGGAKPGPRFRTTSDSFCSDTSPKTVLSCARRIIFCASISSSQKGHASGIPVMLGGFRQGR